MGKVLYARVGPEEFNLHLHRTEVVKDPPGANGAVIFPLRRKYLKANYVIEALESRQEALVDETLELDKHSNEAPIEQVEDRDAQAVPHSAFPSFKIDARGRRLPIDPRTGLWIKLKRGPDWKPKEVPGSIWNELDAEERERLRQDFPQQPGEPQDPVVGQPVAQDDTPVVEDPAIKLVPDVSVGLTTPAVEFGQTEPDPGSVADYFANFWESTPESYVFHRIHAGTGWVDPRREPFISMEGCPPDGSLISTRLT